MRDRKHDDFVKLILMLSTTRLHVRFAYEFNGVSVQFESCWGRVASTVVSDHDPWIPFRTSWWRLH